MEFTKIDSIPLSDTNRSSHWLTNLSWPCRQTSYIIELWLDLFSIVANTPSVPSSIAAAPSPIEVSRTLLGMASRASDAITRIDPGDEEFSISVPMDNAVEPPLKELPTSNVIMSVDRFKADATTEAFCFSAYGAEALQNKRALTEEGSTFSKQSFPAACLLYTSDAADD